MAAGAVAIAGITVAEEEVEPPTDSPSKGGLLQNTMYHEPEYQELDDSEGEKCVQCTDRLHLVLMWVTIISFVATVAASVYFFVGSEVWDRANLSLAWASYCAFLALLNTAYLVSLHLHWYTNQRHQRRIVRILLMCPIYALSSVASLKLHHSAAQYIDVVRDSYEAFVLFNFYHLIYAYIHVPDRVPDGVPGADAVPSTGSIAGGDGSAVAAGAAVTSFARKAAVRTSRPTVSTHRGQEGHKRLNGTIHWLYEKKAEEEGQEDVEVIIKHPPPFCCLSPVKVTRKTFVWFDLFVLQFVVLKPLLCIFIIVGTAVGFYDEEAGLYDYHNAYPYVLLLENLSVTIAFSTIFYLYILVKPVLGREDCCPVTCPNVTAKFIAIKIVIFLCFWQGMAITFLVKMKWIHPTSEWTETEVAHGMQDFLVAVEMSVISFVHHYVFSHKPYRGKDRWHSKCSAMVDAMLYDQSSEGKGFFGQIWAYFKDIAPHDDETPRHTLGGPSGQGKPLQVPAAAKLTNDSFESMPTKRAMEGESVGDSGIQVAT